MAEVIWTVHALERFTERALLYGLSRTELEQIIRKQAVRIDCGFDEKYRKRKFETVGPVANKFFTVEKAEDKKTIIVITLWESGKKEVDLWLSRQK
ncbi:MAG: hypothetical protein V1494_06765 [Candidatus Diapherotrites archaeon]